MGENRKYALEFQTKLDFYFVALVFTVLGLSLQTGQIERQYCLWIPEILAWVSLFASGLAGLARLEWTPLAYIHRDEKAYAVNTLKALDMPNRTIVSQSDYHVYTDEELDAGGIRKVYHSGTRKVYHPEAVDNVV